MNSLKRENWLRERKTYIGGSDIGSIVGVNPHKSCLDVYLEKVSEGVIEGNTSEAAYWGNALEGVIAKEYAKRTGYSVEKPVGLIRHKEYSFIACNIDYWVVDEDGHSHILECKTANQLKAQLWGEEWTNQIPDSYQMQVAYYGAITGVEKIDIAVLIGGQEFRIYRYIRDVEVEKKVIEVAKKFWNDYVARGIPPKAESKEDMAKLFPKGNGLEVKADETILQKIDMLQDLKAKESFITKEIEHLQIEVKNYMQDAELLVDNAGHLRATWKNRKGSKRLDTKTLEEEHNEIYKQYLKEGEAYRVFALKQ